MGGPNDPHDNDGEDGGAVATSDPENFFPPEGENGTAKADVPEPEDTPEPEPEPEPPAEAARQGSTEREYLVHEELELDEKLLKQLLKDIEKGKPLVVLVEVERVEARTVADAIRTVWKKHGERYGNNGVTLVVGAANRIQRKQVKVKPPKVTQDSLEIS